MKRAWAGNPSERPTFSQLYRLLADVQPVPAMES